MHSISLPVVVDKVVVVVLKFPNDGEASFSIPSKEQLDEQLFYSTYLWTILFTW